MYSPYPYNGRIYSPYQYSGTTAYNWQYTICEIVRLHELEWFHLASFCNSFVSENGLHGRSSTHQEENYWRLSGYESSFQELRHSSNENHEYSVQGWNSTGGNFFNLHAHPNQNLVNARIEKLAVEPVIKLFLKNHFFYLPLQNTYTKYGFHSEVLKALPDEYPNYFEKYGNLLFFKPKIEICEAHCLGEGCLKGEMCCDIHLCIDFVSDECYDPKCKFGHNWKIDHNLKVFKKFYMNVKSVSLNYLNALLCDKLLSFKSPKDLQLCYEYDNRGCTNMKCLKIHICFKYLTAQLESNFTQNSCDSNKILPKCMKNHDIKSKHNKKILIVHKLNFNDTPWNLIMTIKNLVHLKNTDMFPALWRKMYGMELFARVPLDYYSEEFQKIKYKFDSEMLIYRIVHIVRIQNPFLWKAFSNKVEEMTAIYINEECVNIQYLYHGTKEHLLNKICAENFDWRLHGCNVGAAYGKGAYFSPYARIATNYCDKLPNHYNYIFLARVAVGQICLGKREMTRPPPNPFTKRPFDSTCDQLFNPRRIVKYDKQEYYPEYILTIIQNQHYKSVQ